MAASRNESFGSRLSARIVASARAQASSTELLYAFLRTSSSEANLGTSTGTQTFRYICPADRQVCLERLTVKVIAKGIDPSDFGGGGELANGLKVEVFPTSSGSTSTIDFLDGQTIKKNADWATLAGSDTPILGSPAPQADDGVLSVRWTIGRSGFGLQLSSGENIAVTTQDDLTPSTTITEMYIMAQGAIFSST